MPSHKKSSKRGRKSQKMYKMKGCKKTSRIYLGRGGKLTNLDLAYPTDKLFSVPNPNLAYVGRGGSTNINAKNPIMPNTGPVPLERGIVPIPPASMQRGGDCGCNTGMKLFGGGHRSGCRCSQCKKPKGQSGGNGLPFGLGMPQMNGIPFPNGLTGQSWNANGGWPGTGNVTDNFNHYADNTYNNDISRQMLDIGANPPFSNIIKGGSNMKLKGGATTSNFLLQDLTNVGRQLTSGLGNFYNGFNGYSASASPMPFKGQLDSTSNLKAFTRII